MTTQERLEYAAACAAAARLHAERARMYRAAYGADSILAIEHTEAARLMNDLAARLRESD